MADQIAISTALKVDALNTPLDARTRVATSDSIQYILNPYVGMHIWISDLAKLVVVTSIQKNTGLFTQYSIKTTLLDVFDAPNDGKFYCRWNNRWIDVTDRLKRPNYIKVTIAGPSTAKWYLNSNSHSYASGLSAQAGVKGLYIIKFKQVPGYTKPLNKSVTVTTSWNCDTYSLSGTYIELPTKGFLKVGINGCDAGRWSTDSTSWHASGLTVLKTAGAYTVRFLDVSGYNKPSDILNVVVNVGLTTQISSSYTPATTQQYVYYGLANAVDFLALLFDVDGLLTDLQIALRIQQGLIKQITLLLAMLKDFIIKDFHPEILSMLYANNTILVPNGYEAKFHNLLIDDYEDLYNADYPLSTVLGTKTRTVNGITYKLYTTCTEVISLQPFKVFKIV